MVRLFLLRRRKRLSRNQSDLRLAIAKPPLNVLFVNTVFIYAVTTSNPLIRSFQLYIRHRRITPSTIFWPGWRPRCKPFVKSQSGPLTGTARAYEGWPESNFGTDEKQEKRMNESYGYSFGLSKSLGWILCTPASCTPKLKAQKTCEAEKKLQLARQMQIKLRSRKRWCKYGKSTPRTSTETEAWGSGI